MPQYTVFVDGAAGTTGLRIHERLAGQPDMTLITLPEAQRKSLDARLAAIEKADVSILCLPDEAAAEIAALAPADAKICDTSTAHRTQAGWEYGLPEVGRRRSRIAAARRVAVPGCYPTGFLALAAPLVETGAVSAAFAFSIFAVTGYSGGGKSMIAAYEDPARDASLDAPSLYGMNLTHKHRPEMQTIAGLITPPLFCPVVSNYYAGMMVTLPLPFDAVASEYRSVQKIARLLGGYYENEPLFTVSEVPEGTILKLAAGTMANRDSIELFVSGNEGQLLLSARYDNLGKGASGAAVQCMNLVLGREETAGLVL